MRILLLGKNGQLGWELHRALSPLGSIYALDFPEIDMVQPDTFVPIIRNFRPQILINAAAYTAVDKAENDRQTCMAVNAHASSVLAEIAKELNSALVHYSTDYVFDGKNIRPNREIDPPNPLNMYGQSKLAGEQAIEQVGGAYLIFRTSWVYSLRGENFVTKTLRWARQHSTLRIVTDQIGNPTWARMLAEITAQLLAIGAALCRRDTDTGFVDWITEYHGLYHLAGDGSANRLEWAQEILKLDPCAEEHTVHKIQPARSADFPTPALRPFYSALDCSRFKDTFGVVYGLQLPEWRDALRMALDQAS